MPPASRQSSGYAGGEFNINSTKQLGEVLFERLNLPPVKKTKTGYSTNAEVLEKLADKHPMVRQVMEYRVLTKLKSTYADGLLKVIGPDGRIRTTFQNLVTATGRPVLHRPQFAEHPGAYGAGQRDPEDVCAPPWLGICGCGLQPD